MKPNLAGLLLIVTVSVALGYAQGGSSEAASAASAESSRASSEPYPKDIYPESRNRLPLVKREDLNDAGKEIYDAGKSSLAGLQGPAGIRLWSTNPRFDREYLRFRNPIGRRLSELVILVAVRGVDGAFEWYAHVPEALRVGLEPQIIDIVRDRKPLTGLGEKESIIIQIGREFSSTHKISSDTFARALKIFGPGNLVDLVSLMGMYTGGALLTATFDQQVPAEVPAGDRRRLPIP